MKTLITSLVLASALGLACSSSKDNNNNANNNNVDAGTQTPEDSGQTEVPDAEPVILTPDDCIDGQDLDAADIDISKCPPIPESAEPVFYKGKKIDLGAWEIGTTAEGKTYKYGSLSEPGTDPRVLTYCADDSCKTTEEVAVNAENLSCWAKNYYRLRKILQDPPAEWLTLRNATKPDDWDTSIKGAWAGYQYRFFQFQTDLRNGSMGYKKIASFQDHLVKWVSVVDEEGKCDQTTLSEFKAYAASEVKRRKLTPATN